MHEVKKNGIYNFIEEGGIKETGIEKDLSFHFICHETLPKYNVEFKV